MKPTHALLSALALTLLASARADDKPRHYNVQVWKLTNKEGTSLGDFRYPERDLPELKNRLDVGIALSGGGSRAATASCGQFRALHELGLLKRVGALSSISGGTWFALPYVYAKPELAPNPAHRSLSQDEYDHVFLGRYLPPEKLTVDDFFKTPTGSWVEAMPNIKWSLAKVLLHASGDESYASQINRCFLKPFGLGDKGKFFTWSEDVFQRTIKPSNAQLKPEQFYFAAQDRPFIIANASLERAQRTMLIDKLRLMFHKGMFEPTGYYDEAYYGFWNTEITPLYTGTPKFSPRKFTPNPLSLFEQNVGGGYVQTFGYDTRFLSWNDEAQCSAHVRACHHLWPGIHPEFSLADTAAASGAAPAAFAGELTDLVGYRPEFVHWQPVHPKPNHEDGEYGHVDGGACDNTGIIPLVMRGTRKIMVLLNSVEEFPMLQKSKDSAAPPTFKDDSSALPTSLTSLFGKNGREGWRNAILQAKTNHVFRDDGGLAAIAAGLARANRLRQPMVHTGRYVTVSNDRFGVKAGQAISVCWVYLVPAKLGSCACTEDTITNSQLDAWIERLGRDTGCQCLRELFSTKSKIEAHKLKNFPCYNILGENSGNLQHLTPLQANALAHYSSFCIMEAKAQIHRWLSE